MNLNEWSVLGVHRIFLITVALALLTASPASAITPPPIDPGALPPDVTGPDQPTEQRVLCASPTTLPGSGFHDPPWSNTYLGVADAHKFATGAGVTVAVIDTGVDASPRVPAEPGGDFVDQAGNGLSDCDAHGTLTASIIAGRPAPTDGFVGVAPDARLLSLRQTSEAFEPVGSQANPNDPNATPAAGSIRSLARAVVHAANLGVGVINISEAACYKVSRPIDETSLGASIDYAVTRKSAQRRDEGVAGLARYLVASATRIADRLASHGVDAVCGRSFDDYDHATDIGFVREKWSMIKGRDAYTAAYAAPGGPDVWWSARADHTITRVRVAPGMAPQSTVLLTTADKPKTPRGFARLFGGQRPALQGQHLVANRHCQLPIGSAGVLVGETVNRCPVYMPFDDVDIALNLGDAQTFTQFVVRAAAAGAMVTVGPQFEEFARLIGAHIGQEVKVAWPNATTYLGPHPGIDRVILRHNVIGTPRHRQLPIRRVSPPEESRYQMALPK